MKNLVNIRLANGKTINYDSFNSFEDATKTAKQIASDMYAISAFVLGTESSEGAKIYVDDTYVCDFEARF